MATIFAGPRTAAERGDSESSRRPHAGRRRAAAAFLVAALGTGAGLGLSTATSKGKTGDTAAAAQDAATAAALREANVRLQVERGIEKKLSVENVITAFYRDVKVRRAPRLSATETGQVTDQNVAFTVGQGKAPQVMIVPELVTLQQGDAGDTWAVVQYPADAVGNLDPASGDFAYGFIDLTSLQAQQLSANAKLFSHFPGPDGRSIRPVADAAGMLHNVTNDGPILGGIVNATYSSLNAQLAQLGVPTVAPSDPA